MRAGSTRTPTSKLDIIRMPSRIPISAWNRRDEKYQKTTPTVIMVAVMKTARPAVVTPLSTARDSSYSSA